MLTDTFLLILLERSKQKLPGDSWQPDSIELLWLLVVVSDVDHIDEFAMPVVQPDLPGVAIDA